MPIIWAPRIAVIAKIWVAFRFHIMVCRPLFTVIIHTQIQCQMNACRQRQVVAFHQHSMAIYITIQRAQQVAMALLANMEMSQHRQAQPIPILQTIPPSIQTNRHHFCCPHNCTKVYLPMPFFIVRIKCVRIHFLAIYYFHIPINRPIRPTLKMMKNPQLLLRLVWCDTEKFFFFIAWQLIFQYETKER